MLSAWADAVGASETDRRLVCELGQMPVGLWSRVPTRTRGMWVLAEHLARNDGQVHPAELSRALLSSDVATPPTQEAWLDGDVPRVPHPRSWAGEEMTPTRGAAYLPDEVTTVPVGLVPDVDLEVIARRARRAAAVGQSDPLGLDLAAVEAVAVAAVARSADPVDPDELVGHVIAEAWSPGLHAALRSAPGLARWEAHAQQMALQLNRYPKPVASAAVGLAAFLRHPDDAWAAMTLALRVGAEPATAAALAAALSGARHGEQALPESLEVPPRLQRAADSLASLARPS